MGIQLMSGFGNLQSYYKTSEIPVVSPEEVKQQQTNTNKPETEIVQPSYSQPIEQPAVDNRTAMADLENISLTFNKEDDFDYIGSESGLANLDMQKAISDMQKDQVLQQYQYFVGSAQSLLEGNEDGIVIPKF